jgi:hypothetical protein
VGEGAGVGLGVLGIVGVPVFDGVPDLEGVTGIEGVPVFDGVPVLEGVGVELLMLLELPELFTETLNLAVLLWQFESDEVEYPVFDIEELENKDDEVE